MYLVLADVVHFRCKRTSFLDISLSCQDLRPAFICICDGTYSSFFFLLLKSCLALVLQAMLTHSGFKFLCVTWIVLYLRYSICWLPCFTNTAFNWTWLIFRGHFAELYSATFNHFPILFYLLFYLLFI